MGILVVIVILARVMGKPPVVSTEGRSQGHLWPVVEFAYAYGKRRYFRSPFVGHQVLPSGATRFQVGCEASCVGQLASTYQPVLVADSGKGVSSVSLGAGWRVFWVYDGASYFPTADGVSAMFAVSQVVNEAQGRQCGDAGFSGVVSNSIGIRGRWMIVFS